MAIFCSKCGKNNEDGDIICNSCNSPLQISHGGPLEIGVIIENRYKIIELLKVGGMGAVYKALDNKLDRVWAVKELLPPYGTREEQREAEEWFNREAKLLSRLDHPNLPIVSDYFLSNGRYYLVMNFIEGEDLDKLLEKEGKPGLPEEKVIDLTRQILQVLDYLHSKDPPIVYRDIKPGNIMLHKDGRAMLIDFGIAKAIKEAGHTKNTVIGTEGYAPPEQCRGDAEPRSDLYALGAMMHHLLTGLLPVPFMFEPLRKINPHISPELEQVVMKALKNKLSGRFSSAKEMLAALALIKPKTINVLPPAPFVQIKTGKEPVTSSLTDPQMVLIPGGLFDMGNNRYEHEKPVHNVRISHFYMNKYQVTNKEYCKFLNSRGNQSEGRSSWISLTGDVSCGITRGIWGFKVKAGYENRPAGNVTWYGAVSYCNWLSQENGYIPCYGEKDNRGHDPSIWRKKNGYRLPGEAEWEYACRAATTTVYYWGDEMDGDYCWYSANSDGNHQEVGKKKPNSFELYDMLGNVWEWCNDWYDNYLAEDILNPTGPYSGTARVIRGASWANNPEECRLTNRSSFVPYLGNVITGFRVVRTK